MNDSCHTHEWVMSHTWKSHVTHMNESCHTHEWVMSQLWRSHRQEELEWVGKCVCVTRLIRLSLCGTWLICMHRRGCGATGVWQHVQQSCVTRTNKSCRNYECVTGERNWSESENVCTWHDSFICLYVGHDSFICTGEEVERLESDNMQLRSAQHRLEVIFYMCDMAPFYLRVPWLNCMGDMTQLYVWRGSIICVAWHTQLRSAGRRLEGFLYMCDMTPFSLHVCHDLFTRVTWLNHMCDVTELYVLHDTRNCALHSTASRPFSICVTWLLFLHVCHDSFTCATGLSHMCDMVQLYVLNDTRSCAVQNTACAMSHI